MNVTLPNGTCFAGSYEKIRRKNLPGNIKVTRTRAIGPRKRCTRNKNMKFALANTPTQDRTRRIRKKYRKLQRYSNWLWNSGRFSKIRHKHGLKSIKRFAWTKINRQRDRPSSKSL